MSKNIIVDEAGLPKALTVDALRTNKQGIGSEDWVPADGKNLVELDIGGSGTYQASAYGAYGIAVARVTPKYGGGATSKAAQQAGFGNLHIPAIREGGMPVLLSAHMVKTNLQGGGTCLWVPEDEVNLDTKYVNHSGTYTASADGCYGYSQVTVSGVDVEITQDDDGNDVAEITDGGETQEVKLPSSIVVVTPPAKLVYNDGELIDFHGIVVKGYNADGTEWGVIPNDELSFPEPIAEFNPNTYVESYGTATSDLIDGSIIFGAGTIVKLHPSGAKEVYQGEVSTAVFTDDQKPTWRAYVVFASRSNPVCTYSEYWSDGSGPHNQETLRGSSYTYQGKTVYWTGSDMPYHDVWGEFPLSMNAVKSSYSADSYKIAWTMIYGTLNVMPGGSIQTIPVQWHRPVDGLSFSDDFTITVNQPENSGSGQEPQPAPTPSPN